MKFWIGEVIRKARVLKGLTQEALGAAIGYKQSYISKMEKGLKDPGFHKLLLMLEVLGITLASIMEGRVE
jgi:transcriptional regulator with XRE-family HTH domain